MGFLDGVAKATFKIAEGIGKTFEKGATLPGKSVQYSKQLASWTGSKIQAGVHGFGEALGNPRQALASAGFVSSPKQYAQNLGAAAKNFGQTMGPMVGRGTHNFRQGFVSSPKQYFQNLGAAAKQAGSHFGPSIGRGMRGLAGGFGALLGAGGASSGGSAGGATTGKVATGMGKLASPSMGVPKAVALFHQLVAPAALLGAVALFKKLTFGLSESNRDLAKWNGGLAASFARLDIAQMRMDIQTANATSGTGMGLNDALAEVLTEFQPIREDLGILVNLVGISAAKTLKTLIEMSKVAMAAAPWMKEIIDGLHIIEDEMKKDKPTGGLGNQALSALTQPGFQPGGAKRDNVDKARGQFMLEMQDKAWKRE